MTVGFGFGFVGSLGLGGYGGIWGDDHHPGNVGIFMASRKSVAFANNFFFVSSLRSGGGAKGIVQ